MGNVIGRYRWVYWPGTSGLIFRGTGKVQRLDVLVTMAGGSQMTIARDIEFEDRTLTGNPVMSTSEVLQKAHAMAAQIEKLLMSPNCRMPASETFRLRLARAHALSLLDQLAELVARRPSDDVARVGRPRSSDEDIDVASGSRPVSSLR